MRVRSVWVGILFASALLAGCSGGPATSGSTTIPSIADPSSSVEESLPDSLDDPEGPIQTPLDFTLVKATSCDPSIVPQASPAPSPNPSPSPAAQLHVPILMYHRVLPANAGVRAMAGLIVSPTEFDAQLAALQKAGWSTITMAALAGYLQANTPAPPKTFAITLDDGHFDSYQYALPIIENHGFVATFYVVAGRVGHPDNMSAVQVADLPRHGMEVGNHTVDHIGLAAQPSSRLTYEIDTAEASLAALTGIWPVSFAYPRGRWDAAAVAALRSCSQISTGVLEGRGSPELWSDRLTMKRIPVGPGRSPADLLAEVERSARG